ncbi:hypothetical protein GCM10011494_08590 [Novosphingobium endophyticum]|uniref:Uncharacterized protein n=1 Tax=Novosphingobium endophyticum TaxID=1955250 RepID=A0A916TQM2_9SPHN|nr:hypothetical protein [Novosphingobium endophyticum]GGB92497.1 hypothetical protein GCM10011494_08590 [Novosphingobium endophyticum]
MSALPADQARYIFTLTGGRTGTAWLAHFLGASLDVQAVHEWLRIDDFGLRMPDIKIMRSFNERGNDALVQSFWKGKLDEIAPMPLYIETNHTLGKCGLVENLAGSPLAAATALIVLRRDLVTQCKSYIARGDFLNITINWQWYLHTSYKNAIINPAPFLQMGQVGLAIWYTYEMDVRQHYYVAKYADRLRLIEARLEQITSEPGARALLDALGFADRPVRIPPPSNTGGRKLDAQTAAHVEQFMGRIDYNPEALLRAYASDGRSLDGLV